MGSALHRIRVQQHLGSSLEDIEHEPDWGAGHQHRIGYRNQQDRFPGITHRGDEKEDDRDFETSALKEINQLRDRVNKGDLINFRDAISQQKVGSTRTVQRGPRSFPRE